MVTPKIKVALIVSFGLVLAAYCSMLWRVHGKSRLSESKVEAKAAGVWVASYQVETDAGAYEDVDVWLEKKSYQETRVFWLKRVSAVGYWLVLRFEHSPEASIRIETSTFKKSFIRVNPGLQYYIETEAIPEERLTLTFHRYGLEPRESTVVRLRRSE